MTAVASESAPRPSIERARSLGRRSTWWLRPLPDVVVIGAMKAGTSTVYAMLREHPRVRGPERKELHFLDRHFDRGPRWYRAQFPVGGSRRSWLAAEATPYYLSFPPGPRRLATVAPDARLVVLLRDPVDRAVSQWKQRHTEQRDERTLAEVVAEERGLSDDEADDPAFDPEAHRRRILVHGHYAIHLRTWFGRFGRNRVLVRDAADLFAAPQATMAEIFSFLDVEPITVRDTSPRNAGVGHEPDDAAVHALREYYRPHNEQLFALLGERFPWQ